MPVGRYSRLARRFDRHCRQLARWRSLGRDPDPSRRRSGSQSACSEHSRQRPERQPPVHPPWLQRRQAAGESTYCLCSREGVAACRLDCGRVELRDRNDGRAAGARGHRRQNGASDDRGPDHAAHISDARAVERKDITACLLDGIAAWRADLTGTADNWHAGAALGGAGRDANRCDLSTRGRDRTGDRQCSRRGCNCDKPMAN
jgi:hypothetical protein